MNIGSKNTTSPWPFAVATILLACFSIYLYNIFATVHWPIRGNIFLLKHELETLSKENKTEGSGITIPKDKMQVLEQGIEKVNTASSSVMQRLAIYHLTGLGAFICNILALLKKPRWVGYIALPFGLIGLFCAVIVM